MPLPSVRLMSAAVMALLDPDPLNAYDSIVSPAPPVDENGVLEGYAVFHGGAGNETSGNLAKTPGQLLWSFQVNCVGGDSSYVGWVVDEVRRRLSYKTLTVVGAKVGLLQPPVGFHPPVINESTVTPPRLTVPLQYQVLAIS